MKTNSVEASIKTATQPLVDSLLAMNSQNRTIRKRTLERYKAEIQRGGWLVTNQGIGVSSEGVLVDGQHRLLAIKELGYPPVDLLVVTGLSPEVKFAVDQHCKRSARDMLHFAFDYRVSRNAPAIATCILRFYENEMILSSSLPILYDKITEYEEEIEFVVGLPKSETFFPAPVYSALCVLLKNGEITQDKVRTFVCQVESGEMLTSKDPAFHLRNLIITSKMSGGGDVVRKERFYKTLKAAKAFADGRPMSVLRA